MIVFPVTEKASEDEEYTMVMDATGRAIDTSEVVRALNAVPKVMDEMLSLYLGGIQQSVLTQTRAELMDEMGASE